MGLSKSMKSVLKKTEVIPRSGCLEGILPATFMVNATQIGVFIYNNINHKGEFGQCSLRGPVAAAIGTHSEWFSNWYIWYSISIYFLRKQHATSMDICIYEYLQEADATFVASPMPPWQILGPPAESLGMDAKIPRLGHWCHHFCWDPKFLKLHCF